MKTIFTLTAIKALVGIVVSISRRLQILIEDSAQTRFNPSELLPKELLLPSLIVAAYFLAVSLIVFGIQRLIDFISKKKSSK